MKTELTVTEFSMLPVQAGLEIETPEGVGVYEGITSSGIVKVFIDGGIREFSWSECTPKIMLRHVLMIEDFVTKWKNERSQVVSGEPEDKWQTTEDYRAALELLKSKFIENGKIYYEWPNINRSDIRPKIIDSMNEFASHKAAEARRQAIKECIEKVLEVYNSFEIHNSGLAQAIEELKEKLK